METSPPVPGKPQQLSTRIVFFLAGICMAAWAPLVPYAKARAQIEDGLLGLLLLCLGAGSIMAMPLAGAMAGRLGCRRVILISTVLLCASLPLLGSVSSFPLLMLSLLLFGASLGALDVTMNIQAILVERASGKTMMSGFHGLFSLGGIVGSVAVTTLLGAGATPLHATLGVVAVSLILLAFAAGALLPYGTKSDAPLFAIPHGIVLLIGAVCFIAFMTEGAVLDWSAVFLSSTRGMETSHAGLGYAAFSVIMTVMRLTGDRLVRKMGESRVLFWGGLLAAAGVLLATLGPSWQWALAGYALVGFGCANMAPIMFSAAGRQTAMPENVAVPAITSLGYAGILAGPAAIGFISHLTSLSVAFLMVAMMLVGVSLSVRFLKL